MLPGKLNAPPHCHSAEEEIFVVLEGEGHLLLWVKGEVTRASRSGAARSSRGRRERRSRTPSARGHDGLTLLMYGTSEPNDICYYPRSRKVYLRGIGLVGRLERLDYWDGEE